MLKYNGNFEKLKDYGFNVNQHPIYKYLIAHKNKEGNQCFYRLSVDENTRIFRKVKYHIRKCNLEVKVTSSDLQDLIKDGLVDKEK